MFAGEVAEFVEGLRGARGFDASTLAFEAVPTDALRDAYADLTWLIRRLEAARVSMAGVLTSRRPDPAPPGPTDGAGVGRGRHGGDGDEGGPGGRDGGRPPDPVDLGDRATRAAARLSRQLADLPHTKAAFDTGRLTMAQATALSRLAQDPTLGEAARCDEPLLVAKLIECGPDRSSDVLRDWRQRVGAARAKSDARARYRKRGLRSWRDDEGVDHWHITAADGVAAELHGLLRSLTEADWTRARRGAPHSGGDLEGPIDERTREQRSVDVLVWGLRLGVAGLSAGAKDPQPRSKMMVGLDYDDLLARAGATDLATGTLLTGEDARRLACDAGIIRLLTKGGSVPLDRGRETRLATRAQREALAAIHPSCARPGCHAPFSWTEVHHVDEFVADEGETNIEDLLPLCDHDHHRVHEGGHRIERGDRPGEKLWVTPDGGRHHIRPRPPSHRVDRPPGATPPPGPSPPGTDEQLDLLGA